MEKDQLMELRSSFTELLIANENHFGNLEKSPQTAKINLKMNTHFEEIGCVSYNPQSEELRASVVVKQVYGYGGDLCSKGSIEYVRFYLNFGSGWVDQGLALFNAHDIPRKGPLCYTAVLKIDPEQDVCKKEVLPRVRAILSWSQIPPANQPNWTPVWGNRMDRRIQIAPDKPWQKLIASLSYADGKKVSQLLEKQALQAPTNFKETALYWGKEYEGEVERERLQAFLMPDLKKLFPVVTPQKLNKVFNLGEVTEEVSLSSDFFKGKCNTGYEELRCIGFNRQFHILHGAIEIKRPYGYFGNLCQKGSKEYVTFFIRPLGSGTWNNAGTTSVQVHDLKGATKESIWYNAWLPINIDKYRRVCQDPQIMEVQAILSWNAPATVPDVCPYWGNIVKCQFEIPPKKTDDGVPYIESLGGIQEDAINSVTGLADGQSYYSTNIKADESPFDGAIEINGIVDPGAKYQVLIKEPGASGFTPLVHSFPIVLNTLSPSPTQTVVTQSPDPSGYYTNLEDPANFKWVNERRLMNYYPINAGLHQVKVRTFSGVDSNVVTFMVDKDQPKATLAINPAPGGSPQCKHQVGSIMTGTFSFEDSHFRRAVLFCTPNNGGGAGPKFDLTGDADIVQGLDISGTFINAATGFNTWSMNTANMKPCGYVLNLRVSDRTIVNSAYVGKSAGDSKGFCLEI